MSRGPTTCQEVVTATRAFLGDSLRTLGGVTPRRTRGNILLRARAWSKAAFFLSHYHERAADIRRGDIRRNFRKLVVLLRDNQLSRKQMHEALQHFNHQLVEVIEPGCSSKKRKQILKQIIEAETYVTAFHDRPVSTVVELEECGARYEVTTKAGDDLCRTQVKALYADLADQEWYAGLPLWERRMLAQAVTEDQGAAAAAADEGYDPGFYAIKTPTAGARPGGSNFGCDIYTVESEEYGNQRAVSYYHSVPSKLSEAEAVAVLADFFETYQNDMIADFTERGHYRAGNRQPIVIPLLMESFLTPAWYEAGEKGSDNNTRMQRFREAAIQALIGSGALVVEKNGVQYQFDLIDNNQPINGRRGHVPGRRQKCLTGGEAIVDKSIQAILDFTDTPEAEKRALNAVQLGLGRPETTLANFDLERLPAAAGKQNRLFIETLHAYLEAWQRGPTSPDKENHALFLAACEMILIQEAGGVADSNCKSTKDRAGLVKSEVVQMRSKYAKEGVLARYGQQYQSADDKKMFVECVTEIPGVIANNVAAGARGSKDEPFLGDAMTPVFATKHRRFKENKKLAGLNRIKAKALPKESAIARRWVAAGQAQVSLVSEPVHSAQSVVTRFLDEAQRPSLRTELTAPCFGMYESMQTRREQHLATDRNDLRDVLYREIFELKKKKSEVRGINLSIVEHDNFTDDYAKHTLLRDARDMDPDLGDEPESLGAYNYAQIGLSYAIAAETLYDVNGYQSGPIDRRTFQQRMMVAVTEFKNAIIGVPTYEEQEEVLRQFVANRIAPLLMEASGGKLLPGKIIDKLDNIKNWVAMYQPTAAVATVDKVATTTGEIEIVRIEEPLTALTPALREEYTNRTEKDWYRFQSAETRALIDHFMDHILAGHQIPSQLRKFLPGLKNAYRSTTYARVGGQLVKLSHSNHCAAIVPVIMPDHQYLDAVKAVNPADPIAQLSHKERDKRLQHERHRLTQLGLLQQRAVTGATSNTMVALNSTLADDMLKLKDFFTGGTTEALDKEMAILTVKAAQGLEDTTGAKVCLNKFNLVEPNQDASIKAFREHAERLYKRLQSHYAERQVDLTDNSTHIARLMGLMKASLDRLQKRCDTSRLRRLFNKADKESVGVKIVQEFTTLIDLYNGLLEREGNQGFAREFKRHEAFYACASGENRTGIVEYAAQASAVMYNLQGLTGRAVVDEAELYRILAESGHLQFITGSQGGIMGAESLRDKSMAATPKKFADVKQVISKAYAGCKSVAKKIFSDKRAVIARQARVRREELGTQEIHYPETQEEARCEIRLIRGLLLNWQETAGRRDLGHLMNYCDRLLSGAEEAQQKKRIFQMLIEGVSTVCFKSIMESAKKREPMTEQVRELLSALTESTGNHHFREVAEFSDEDLAEIRKSIKSKRFMRVAAATGVAGAVILFPASALFALKFPALKALAGWAGVSLKIGIDGVAAVGSGMVARSRANSADQAAACTRGTLFSSQHPDGAFAHLKEVMAERGGLLERTLRTFKKMFGVSKEDAVYVNRIPEEATPAATTPDVEIDSARYRDEGHYVVSVDLSKSKLPHCQQLSKRMRAGASDTEDRSNNISLGFKQDDLRRIRVNKKGDFTPAVELVDFLYAQGKSELRLTGVLSEAFVAEVNARAKSLRIVVIDERASKRAASPTSVIQGIEGEGVERPRPMVSAR